jgi:hypothetical protein
MKVQPNNQRYSTDVIDIKTRQPVFSANQIKTDNMTLYRIATDTIKTAMPKPETTFTIKNQKIPKDLKIVPELILTASVYMLVKNQLVVYIGKSINPMVRICDHRKYKGTFDAAYYIPVQQEDMDLMEGYLIDLYNPPWNAGSHGEHRYAKHPNKQQKERLEKRYF